jgi:hypothetical protein
MFLNRPRLLHKLTSRVFSLSSLLFFCSSFALAQQTFPSVTFKFDFPGAEPDHYVLLVSADGHASYDSNGKLSLQSDAGDPVSLKFSISQATCVRIFDLAAKAHHFEGKIDSGRKGIANTGTKVLIYADGGESTQATYNYSSLQAVQDLTALFQQLSTTLEFGRRLEYYRRYQKTALDEELTNMERESNQNGLQELAAVTPILRQIANDSSLMNVVRARAQRLLAASAK